MKTLNLDSRRIALIQLQTAQSLRSIQASISRSGGRQVPAISAALSMKGAQ